MSLATLNLITNFIFLAVGFKIAWSLYPYLQERRFYKFMDRLALFRERPENIKDEPKPIPTEPVKKGRKVKFQTHKIK